MQTLKLLVITAFGGLLLLTGIAVVRQPTPPQPAALASPSASPSPSPSPSPAPTPRDPTTWVPFTSARFGYSIRIPADWTQIPGTQPSLYGEENNTLDDPKDDQFNGPDPIALVVTSQAIPAGMTDDAWLGPDGPCPGCPAECWPPHKDWEQITIDGHAAILHGGLPGCDITRAVAFVDGRAYELVAFGNRHYPTQEVFDRGLFDDLMATVVFDAASADDSPRPSSSPVAVAATAAPS
jgi:hypothetical protein